MVICVHDCDVSRKTYFKIITVIFSDLAFNLQCDTVEKSILIREPLAASNHPLSHVMRHSPIALLVSSPMSASKPYHLFCGLDELGPSVNSCSFASPLLNARTKAPFFTCSGNRIIFTKSNSFSSRLDS